MSVASELEHIFPHYANQVWLGAGLAIWRYDKKLCFSGFLTAKLTPNKDIKMAKAMTEH